MERPVLGKLREEIANPQPAGFVERVGITALILPWKKISTGTAIIALAGGGLLSLNTVMTFFENRQQRNGAVLVQLGSEQMRPAEFNPVFQGHILTKNLNPVAMYDGGIIVNDVDGLDIVTSSEKIENTIKKLSWYNIPDRTRPVMTVFAPVSEAQSGNYSFGNTPNLLSRYESEKKVTVYITPTKNIAMWDMLRRYIDLFDHPVYMEKLSYDLSAEFFRSRLKNLNMISYKDIPRDLSNADLEMIQRELPLRVHNINSKVRDFILKG